MKKHQRILKNTEFSSIIQARKSVSSPACVVYLSPRKEQGARIGISVGKKIGKAVVRTRVKRQLRALIDSVFTFNEPFDSIVIVRPPFLKLDHTEKERMLSDIRQKALRRFASQHKPKKTEERGSHEKDSA